MEALTRRLYDAPGWGAGEVWTRGRTVLLHVLAGTDPTVLAVDPSDARSPSQGPPDRASSPFDSALDLGPASPRGAARPPEATLASGVRRVDHAFVADLCRRFAAHLRGDPVAYDDVALDLGGRTVFERDLTRAIRQVPWGEVVTYGELAALAGRPGAARAAGSFCAGSDVALVVPCHRVVAADGIGGYGASGVQLKRRLLALEGVRL